MFIFKLLQGVLKQWQEHGSSNAVLWAASPRVLASLSTRGQCLARAQALTLLDGQFCTMTFPATLVPLAPQRHALPHGLLSSFHCRATSTAYLPLED